MLRRIALKNFKAFEHLEELELRPLTVFCGPNAVGKSSVIQALLMIRQTIDAPRPEAWSGDLVTDGKHVSLGDYVDVVFGHDLGRNLTIALTVPVPVSNPRSFRKDGFWKVPVLLTLQLECGIPYYRAGKGMWEDALLSSAVPELNHLRLTARTEDGQELVTVDAGQETFGDVYVALAFGKDMGHADRHFYARDGAFGLRGLEFNGRFIETTPDYGHALETDDQSGERLDASSRRIEYPTFSLTDWTDDCGAEEMVGLVSRMLNEVTSSLTVHYVDPAREAPQRYYDVDVHSMSAGAGRGQHDWKAGLAFGSPEVRKPQEPDSRNVAIFGGSLDDTIESWLSYLGLPHVHPVLEGRDFRVMVSSPYADECSVSVADTGYGVSQVLPVLLAGAARRDEILVLDQPELHLHPKLQTGMADFAIAVSETRQVLVETHSDHFVNRIVRRVVEGQISSDDVAVYFFTPTSDGPHVEMVEVDPTFGIKNWPLGFFDDYADEQEAIIRASLKRRAEEGRN